LFAGYLLWAGGQEPGGAFQAGAVLAAAGVLAALSGTALPSVPAVTHRLLLLAGIAAFTSAGVAVMALGDAFLEFSPPAAKGLILGIEAAASISIGLGLVAIFRGGRPAAARVSVPWRLSSCTRWPERRCSSSGSPACSSVPTCLARASRCTPRAVACSVS